VKKKTPRRRMKSFEEEEGRARAIVLTNDENRTTTTMTTAIKSTNNNNNNNQKEVFTTNITDAVAVVVVEEEHFISLTQAVEKASHNNISYGRSKNNGGTSQSDRSQQPTRSSPRQKKKHTNSALDRLLNSTNKRGINTPNTSFPNAISIGAAENLEQQQEEQQTRIGSEASDSITKINASIIASPNKYGLNDRHRVVDPERTPLAQGGRVPSTTTTTTLAREFGPDSKERKKKKIEEKKKVDMRVSFPAPSLSWGDADEIFENSKKTMTKEHRSNNKSAKKRKTSTNIGLLLVAEEEREGFGSKNQVENGEKKSPVIVDFVAEWDDEPEKESPAKDFVAEWDDEEFDNNMFSPAATAAAAAAERETIESHSMIASRVANALRVNVSDTSSDQRNMKKLERIDAQGARIAAQRIVRITKKDDNSLVLHVISCRKKKESAAEIKIITLKDHWANIHVEVNDLVRVHSMKERCEIFEDCEITVNNELLLILHPELLLSATMLGGSFQCLRKAFINTTIGDGPGGDASEAATYGTLMHELAEKSLIKAGSNLESNNEGRSSKKSVIEESVDVLARKSALDLFAVNKTVEAFIDHAKSVISGVDKWSKKLTALHRKKQVMNKYFESEENLASKNEEEIVTLREEKTRRFNQPCGGVNVEVRNNGASNSNVLEVSEIVDIEEIIWAPRLGLKGQIDAIAQARVRNGKEAGELKVVPVELKTGKWKDIVEHGAQVLLYTLMIGERYKQSQGPSPFGVLHYTNDEQSEEGKTTVIERNNIEIAYLMHQRNRLAAALQPREEDESSLPKNNEFQNLAGNVGENAKDRNKLASGTLPNMSPNSWCERCFQRDSCFTLHKALESGNEHTSGLQFFAESTVHISQSHSNWLKKWMHLVDLEESASHGKRATPWMDIEIVRARKGGIAINGLKIIHSNIAHLEPKSTKSEDGKARRDSFTGVSPGNFVDDHEWFHTFAVTTSSNEQFSVSQFSPGDRVVLSREDGLMVSGRATILKVDIIPGNIITLVTPRRLRLENEALLPGCANLTDLWRVDRDGAGHSMAARSRGNLIATLAKGVLPPISSGNPSNVNQKIIHIPSETRRRIIEFDEPKFESFTSIKLPSKYRNDFADFERDYLKIVSDLNEEQRNAVVKVVTCSDYALVLGLPGAGKSETLVCCILVLALLEKRVLITSHTHNAVDNILKRLPSKGCENFVRVGDDDRKILKEVRKYRLGGKIWNATSFESINDASAKALIVGATCYAMNHPFFARKEFDIVLVDEAGQLTLPAILGPLLLSKTFALVGDHHQLPPLITSEVARRYGMEESLLAQLCNRNPKFICSLTCQYRMNEPLTMLPNALTYGGKLKPATAAIANRMLSIEEDFNAESSKKINWLASATSNQPNKAVIFLDTSSVKEQTRESLGERPVNKGEQMIVREIARNLIRRKVEASKIAVLSPFNAQVDEIAELLKEDEKTSDVESLTIDKAQGRDFDAVIISFVKSNPRGDTTELLEDERRLNVAITRAKAKLILIGNIETLRRSRAMNKMLDVISSANFIESVDLEFFL
jgi:DNA replication ATP-dependent helicase Dna2